MDRQPGGEFETVAQRWRQLWPFNLAFVLGFALAWLEPDGPENLVYMGIAGAIILAVVISILAGVWSRTSDIATLIPVAGACIAVDLMRAASGGTGSGYGSLLLIPVIWQAMRRRQLELNLTIALVSTRTSWRSAGSPHPSGSPPSGARSSSSPSWRRRSVRPSTAWSGAGSS